MTRLILASASKSRRQILAAAGVAFEVDIAPVDEAAIKAERSADEPKNIALALAEAKARAAGGRHVGALILGADQLLVCEGRVFDKAASLDDARAVLRALSGKKHQLVTAVSLMRDQDALWSHIETSHLWMRRFSEAFLDAYLVDEAEDILSSVGCYRVEGLGAQLFDHIEGDQFSIRGLPLFPLLGALRRLEVLPS
jgi:septum formation protein